MFSIYTSAFNVNKGNFQWREAVRSFSRFAGAGGEVVIAVNESQDSSYQDIRHYCSEYGIANAVVVPVDIPYDHPDMDGLVKNEALQHSSCRYKIGLDLDEYIPLNQYDSWVGLARSLDETGYDSIMVPSVDIYGDILHASAVKSKWYIHKEGLYRGTVNFAKNFDGTHDIEKSDSCELVNLYGQLCNYGTLLIGETDQQRLDSIKALKLPFVVHLGYLDLERRLQINQEFWKKHWEVESGKPAEIATTLKELERPTFEHYLTVEPIYG